MNSAANTRRLPEQPGITRQSSAGTFASAAVCGANLLAAQPLRRALLQEGPRPLLRILGGHDALQCLV